MPQLVDRALAARRESRRIAFRPAFDPSSPGWCDIIKDIAALANSGGGVMLFGVDHSGQPTGADSSPLLAMEPAELAAQIRTVSDSTFDGVAIVEVNKDSKRLGAIIVSDAPSPIVFSKPGDCAFAKGTMYFRHGAKSEPATSADVEDAIDRRVNALRRSWLGAVRRVVEGPTRSSVAVLPPEIRDSDSLDATPIRIVQDSRAPAFRLVDYDKTHPFRQKEVLATLRSRLSDMTINQFDLLAVRHVFNTDDNSAFAHKPLFGTRRYSTKFVEWLVRQQRDNPQFFAEARERYLRERRTAS